MQFLNENFEELAAKNGFDVRDGGGGRGGTSVIERVLRVLMGIE